MLVPPRVGAMAAYTSLRQDAVTCPTIERRPSQSFRQNLQRLARFLDRRQGRSRALSRHPLGISIDSSDTSASDLPTESDIGEVQSVTTFDSSETLNDDVVIDKLHIAGKDDGRLSINAEKFPHRISGTKAKLALVPSLRKNGTDISLIDIDFHKGEIIPMHKRKGLVELPRAVRKDIWRKAIVHDRKLFICNC
jgi:hypothetical protein